MTSSSRRCTRAADAESSSALTHTGEGSLPCCRAAQCPALPCSTQLCSMGSPKTADCVPALFESSARTSIALAEDRLPGPKEHICNFEFAVCWAVHICCHA